MAKLTGDTRIALFSGTERVSDWVPYGPDGIEQSITVTSPGVTHVQVVRTDGTPVFNAAVPHLCPGDEFLPAPGNCLSFVEL